MCVCSLYIPASNLPYLHLTKSTLRYRLRMYSKRWMLKKLGCFLLGPAESVRSQLVSTAENR